MAIIAKDREAFRRLQINPDAFWALENELETVKKARATKEYQFKKIMGFMKDYLRENASPEMLEKLKGYPVLAKLFPKEQSKETAATEEKKRPLKKLRAKEIKTHDKQSVKTL